MVMFLEGEVNSYARKQGMEQDLPSFREKEQNEYQIHGNDSNVDDVAVGS